MVVLVGKKAKGVICCFQHIWMFHLFNFTHGLSADLVKSLNEEYRDGGWWKALVDDPQVFIAIRDEYLNVYWNGNSLLKLFLQNDRLVGEVHYKYMLRPEINGNPYIRI